MTRRSKRYESVSPPGRPDHTSREWVFARDLVLTCPSGHTLGRVRQEAVTAAVEDSQTLLARPKTVVSGKRLWIEGPPDAPRSYLRWACVACDEAAASEGITNKHGQWRRHRGYVHAGSVLELLAAMAGNGPQNVRAVLDPDALGAVHQRVISGEQLQAVEAAEAARVRRRKGKPAVRVIALDVADLFEDQTARGTEDDSARDATPDV